MTETKDFNFILIIKYLFFCTVFTKITDEFETFLS